jgi:O-antigen ligase
MKWLIFFGAIAAVYPLGRWLRGRDRLLLLAVALLGFLPFVSIDINLVSYEHYRGDSRGIEISLLDLLAAALAVALPPAERVRPSYRFVRWLYALACVLSLASAPNPLFGTFSIWKLLRMFAAMALVERLCHRPERLAALLWGLGSGVVYETLLALSQRYLQGAVRVSGNLSHSNSLGMAVNMVFPIAFALLLSGRGRGLAAATVAGAALCVVMSLSRGAIAMYALAALLIFSWSVARRMTLRKASIAIGGAMGATVVLLRALDTIIERFTEAPEASAHGRDLFELAAQSMLRDHPGGVGINQFSHVLSRGGYADRIGIPPIDRDGIVHNIYWLTAAETGYLGIVAYVALLAWPLLVALRALRRTRDSVEADILAGAAVALLLTCAQGTLEWIARQTAMSYLFYFVIAIIAAMATRTSAARSSPARRAALA